MSSEENFPTVVADDGCSHHQNIHSSFLPGFSQHSQANVSDFDRQIPGRQSLDSLCRRHRSKKNFTFKHHSDGFLNQPTLTTEDMCSINDSSHILRQPNTTCDYISDNLNFRQTSAKGLPGECESVGHHCETPTFMRTESSAFQDRERCTNRSLSLASESDSASCTNGGGDLRLEFASDLKSCRGERTSLSVVSLCSVERKIPMGPHSAPVTPCGCQAPSFPPLSLDITSPRLQKRTTLNIEPSPPYMAQLDSASPRSFTSVNLTLRPPSSDPQPPIDINSSAGGALTYTTCTYDRRQGFQSRLSISIGPGGQGSVSAARTKTPVIANENNTLLATIKNTSPSSSNTYSAKVPEVASNPCSDGPISPQLPSPERLSPTTQGELF